MAAMESHLTSELAPHLGRPLRVAIVGSGPSGFYAAESLLKACSDVRLAMYEKFPTPYGLVRFGVAPDHAKIRNVIKVYEKTAADPRFSFYGNVHIGRDVSIDELKAYYDAVVLAHGAQTDRRLNIPGEDIHRSYTATEFCAWYNGHPEYRDHEFDLSRSVAVIVGQGNVAMDVCRILAKDAADLAATDMASHAIQALAHNQVKDIYVVGRRGPAQAAFTPKEIGELGEIPNCDIFVNPADLVLNSASALELEAADHHGSQAKRNMEILQDFAHRTPRGCAKRIFIRFFQSPVELIRDDDGGVQSIVLESNELTGEAGRQQARGTGKKEVLPCSILFRSVGYRGVALDGVPFDEKRAVIPNSGGRVDKGLYVVGWIKRGPSGLIGTNKKDSDESVSLLLEDVPTLTPSHHSSDKGLLDLLAQRGIRVVNYTDWLKIDSQEMARGHALGKPRDNFTRVCEMIAAVDNQS